MFQDKRTGIFQCKIGGNQFSLKTKDKREAKQRELELRKRFVDGLFGLKSPSKLRVKDAMELWLHNRDGKDLHRDESNRQYKLRIEKHILKNFGNRHINSLTTEEVHQWAEIKNKTLSAGTVEKLVNIFRAMIRVSMNPCFTPDFVQHDPIRIWPSYTSKPVGIRLTNDEINLLLNCDDVEYSKIRDLVVFALYTGMRRSNIIGLKWDHIDLQTKTITIPADEFKTGLIHRIPILPQVVDILAKQIGKHETFVFTQPNGKLFDSTDLSRRFRVITHRIGFKRHIRFHDLRHTCGTRLIESGVLLEAVKEYLGHNSSKTTEKYLHMSQVHMQAALTGFNIEPQARPSQMLTE